MGISEDLLERISSYPLREIVIGAFNTLVWSRTCGLASTLREPQRPHQGVRESGTLLSKDVTDLARYILSENLLEASVGMAALNSALPDETENAVPLNAKSLIVERGRDKVVCVIGHFPFLDELRSRFHSLHIFEKVPHEGDLLEQDIPQYLPNADVVAITGTSIPNHTFDGIMKYVVPECYVIVLGPTTPLSSILFDYGVDAVSGTRVLDIPYVLSQVKEATPFRYLKGVEHLTLLRERTRG